MAPARRGDGHRVPGSEAVVERGGWRPVPDGTLQPGMGGEAVANTDDVSSWDGAQHLIAQAVDTFGRLDAVVANASVTP